MKPLKQASIVTVCAACKKRLTPDPDSQAEEADMEKPAAVSHGLCYECILRLYPEIAANIKAPLR